MKLADRSEARRGRPSRVAGRDGTPPRPVIGATISPVQETAAEAITKLIYTYAERIDAGDFAGVAELFAHATLTFEGFGDAVTGRDAIERLYARTTRRYEDGTPRTKHVMTNVMVDVADDGATASSPVVLHRAAGRARRARPAARHRRPLPAHLRAGGRAVAGGDDAHHHRPRRATWGTTCSSTWRHEAVARLRLGLHARGVLGPLLRPRVRGPAPPRGPGLDLGRGGVPGGRPHQRPGADPALRPAAPHARTGAQDLRRGGRHHRGEHLRPGDVDDDLHHDPGHHGRQDAHRGRHRPQPRERQHGGDVLARRPGQDLRRRARSWSASSSTRPARCRRRRSGSCAASSRAEARPASGDRRRTCGPRRPRTVHEKPLDRGARQHTSCGRHTFGRSPGRRTEPERAECVDARPRAAAGGSRAAASPRSPSGRPRCSAEATTRR